MSTFIGARIVGLSEIIMTYWGQSLIGTWVGEYRPILPMLFLVAVLLIEPKGLEGLYNRIRSS